MPVIALTQEMGSLAIDVATRLGSLLNIAVTRHEVIDHVAQQMHVSKSLISRLREGKSGLIERLGADDKRIALYTAEEVYALATVGNVVLHGWGATCLLRSVPPVVCVRITRPMDKRVEWLMNELQIDNADAAREEIRRSDAAHASAMHHRFGVTWGDPLLYDAVFNTERIPVEGCAQAIAALAMQPQFQETPQSRKMLQDLALASTVRAVLNAQCGIDVDVVADGETVTLRGIVVKDSELVAAQQAAAAVAGVARVDNQLKPMKGPSIFPNVSFRP